MIVQHSAPPGNVGRPSLLRLWPFWVLLVSFETLLWLLLSLRFQDPCSVVALAAGLTLGVAVQLSGGRRLHGAVWAAGLTVLTSALALYAQAAFHVSRVLGLPPLTSMADTGIGLAALVLEGLLRPGDWWLIGGGVLLAALAGYGMPARRRRQSASTSQA